MSKGKRYSIRESDESYSNLDFSDCGSEEDLDSVSNSGERTTKGKQGKQIHNKSAYSKRPQPGNKGTQRIASTDSVTPSPMQK